MLLGQRRVRTGGHDDGSRAHGVEGDERQSGGRAFVDRDVGDVQALLFEVGEDAAPVVVLADAGQEAHGGSETHDAERLVGALATW